MKIKKTIIIGAGIVGVSTALWLQRLGCDVLLIDRKPPGQATSFGNAGLLATSSIVPVTTPNLLPKIPSYLLNPQSPLFLRWRHMPKMLPFLLRYLSYANKKDCLKISKAVHYITSNSVYEHNILAGNTKAGSYIQDSAYGYAYKNRNDFINEQFEWAIRAEAGYIPEIIEGDDVQDYQPSLSPNFSFMAILKDHGYIINPGDYISALVEAFIDNNGTFISASVEDFEFNGHKIHKVLTSDDSFLCDQAVIATGAFSKPLMQKLGCPVLLEAERGYHILFKNAISAPTIPIMNVSGKFVSTPMEMGLRSAGVVEFGGLDSIPSKAPLDLLRQKTLEAYPHLEYQGEQEWLGHRPATPDSLPMIGEIRNTGVFAAFGHQHIGLTSAPKTGRLLAETMCNLPKSHDLSAYCPMRF